MVVLNVAAFRPLDQFKREVGEFASYIKRRLAPASRIYFPGELEGARTRNAAERIPRRRDWNTSFESPSLDLTDLVPDVQA